MGSLNGTVLNGNLASRPGRKAGPRLRIAHGDIVRLGERTDAVRLRVDLVYPANSSSVSRRPSGCSTPTAAAAAAAAADDDDATVSSSVEAAVVEPLLVAGGAAAPVVGQWAALGVRWAVWAEAGTFHDMEDVWHVEWPLAGRSDVALLCVFDGHCGAHAALQAKALLPGHVASALPPGDVRTSPYTIPVHVACAPAESCPGGGALGQRHCVHSQD
jgi:hypothetical protein